MPALPSGLAARGPVRVEDHRGAALPLVIFLIGFLTLLLSAAAVRLAADRRIAEASGETWDALTIAQSGLQNYVASKATPPADNDSVRLWVPGGYADVVAQFLRRPADPSRTPIYVLRSTGYSIRPTQGAEPRARRTIAQFARWQVGWLKVDAPFTAANGLDRATGGGGELRGEDACAVVPPIASLRVPAGESPSSLAGFSAPNGVDERWSGPRVADSTKIDWAETIGGGLAPDHRVIAEGDASYSIQLLTGNATLGRPGAVTSGTGLLIVTGDLQTLGDSARWRGVVLVGGRITFSAAENRFDGLIVSGLNEQRGINAPMGLIGGTSLRIFYNSCEVTNALARLTGLVLVRNGFVDNWATY